MKRIRCAAAACALLAGCTTNPITGRSQFVIVSEEQAISGSAAAYSSMIGGLSKKGRVESDTPRARRAREITDRLIAQAVRFRPDSAGWNWQLTVIDEPKVVNAFCMAGGKMAIYTGMWEKLEASDDEIAQVMGHEIGHALASHTRERMSVGLATGIGAAVLAVAVSNPNDSRSAGRNHEGLALAAALAISLPNSREGESEADQIGIELAARAGFDPRAAVTLWQKMAKEAGGSPPEFLSTHPAPENRMRRLAELAPRMEPFYQAARRGGGEPGPAFLSVTANERKVEAVSREDYAARVARDAPTLSFVAEPFERFRRGETVLECRAACAIAYGLQRGDWRKLHAQAAWRELAVSVIKVGYLNDLSYFFLAEAARGLGEPAAARTYYARALEAARGGNSCTGLPDTCEGYDVQHAAGAALGSAGGK